MFSHNINSLINNDTMNHIIITVCDVCLVVIKKVSLHDAFHPHKIAKNNCYL